MVSKRLLASLARKGGGKLLDMAIGRVLGETPSKAGAGAASTAAGAAATAKDAARTTAAKATAKGSLAGKAATVALTQVARRSVPAAIIIGGGMLARNLYKRRHSGKTDDNGES